MFLPQLPQVQLKAISFTVPGEAYITVLNEKMNEDVFGKYFHMEGVCNVDDDYLALGKVKYYSYMVPIEVLNECSMSIYR